MLFSKQLPLATLVNLCHILRHNLDAGLTLRDVFRQQATRGSAPMRPVARRIQTALEAGDSLEAALEQEKDRFPPLFLAMAGVGEQSGHLPEIFKEIGKYYSLQQRLRRQIISQSFLPVIQFLFAILIIAFVIFILGLIGATNNQKPMSIMGFRGTTGALHFLTLSLGSIVLAVVVYLVVLRSVKHRAPVDFVLLWIPSVGPCLEALAVSRLALAMHLTLDSGLPITDALRLSLKATGNAAFEAQIPTVLEALKAGDTLTEALSRCRRVLPQDFLMMIATAEEGGRVPEMMQHQANYYHEEAGRRLQTLARMFTGLVWLIYAGFTIAAIFSIAQVYFGALQIPK
jgi:type II secretory pathway component PulF